MKNLDLIIVGSIGIDTIETPYEKKKDILGGSVSYACAAASFFTQTGMVGVVGTDFPNKYIEIWKQMNIDLEGLQTLKGKTFRWSGVYEENMDIRRTISTELNVFESFLPVLPQTYKKAPYLFLGNIHPLLQLQVLDLANDPIFTLIDTMDLWINVAREDLEKVISKCNMLTLNESEAKLFTQEESLIKASKKLVELGPDFVLIKKGAQGSMLYSNDDCFSLDAYPLEKCCDPTGAGDSFAGGLMGILSTKEEINFQTIKEAMVYGSIIASFGIEAFSLDRLITLTEKEIKERVDKFYNMFLS